MRLNGYVGTIEDREGYLYRDGKTEYKILIPSAATESEKYAAEELTLIFSYAGVSIETVTDENVCVDATAKYIALGNTVYFKALGVKLLQKEFKFDGFIIENVGETYVIKGVGDTGTCFGAYGFMEYIAGYRYYAPDEHAIADEAKQKTFRIKDIPTFFGRNAYSYYTHFDVDHGFRLRINGEYTYETREKKHGEGCPWSTLNDQSYATQILDFHKYAEKHPDWYVWHPDHATMDQTLSASFPQICYSKGLYDEEFYNTFIDNLINDYIIPQSDKQFFMLGMSDNTVFCECDKCKEEVEKYTRSGLAMRFVNKVAADVEKWRVENAPERVIFLVGFAYLTIFDAPVIEENGKLRPIDPSVVARDNVIIQYAPIRANYMYPLMDEEHNKNSRDAILGWKQIAKHMMIWDYRQDFGTQTFFFPTTTTAQVNNDLYAEIGVVDVFNQAQPFTAGSPFIFMDDFARARMHWNAKESYDELIHEFNLAYYKDACPEVEEYMHAFENYYPVMEKRGYVAVPGGGVATVKDFYTIPEMYAFKDILDRALTKANGIADERVREKVVTRVETLTLFYKFVLLLCFTKELDENEALDLIADLRRVSEKVGLKTFFRRVETEKYIAEAEKIVLGEIEETDMFPQRK